MLQSTIDLVVELEKSLPVGWELKRIGRPYIGEYYLCFDGKCNYAEQFTKFDPNLSANAHLVILKREWQPPTFLAKGGWIYKTPADNWVYCLQRPEYISNCAHVGWMQTGTSRQPTILLHVDIFPDWVPPPNWDNEPIEVV